MKKERDGGLAFVESLKKDKDEGFILIETLRKRVTELEECPNESYIARIRELQECIDSLTKENYRLTRWINSHIPQE